MKLEKPTTFVLLGRPGCGKGTQAKFLAKRFGLKILGTGDLLRKFIAHDKSVLAQKVRRVFAAGQLVPSWLVMFLWLREILKVPQKQGIVFDGSPRKIAEAEFLDEVLSWFGRPPALVIVVDVSPRESKRRMKLRGRSDDTERAINARLRAFEREVKKAIVRYRKQGRVIIINGEQPQPEVFKAILKKLV